jgi:hypothetical protein
MSESGVVVYHRVFNESIDEQLFGALMSALNSFAEELAKGGLSSFELSNKRFTILKRDKFHFVATSDKKVKNKKLAQELQLISDKFFELYCLVLDNWDGEISLFENFGKEIEDSLEMTVQKFHEAFY